MGWLRSAAGATGQVDPVALTRRHLVAAAARSGRADAALLRSAALDAALSLAVRHAAWWWAHEGGLVGTVSAAERTAVAG